VVIGDVRQEDRWVRVVLSAREPKAPVLNLNPKYTAGVGVLQVVDCRVKLVGNNADAVGDRKAVASLLVYPRRLCCMPLTERTSKRARHSTSP